MAVPRFAKIVVLVLLALSGPRLSAAADLTLVWDPPSDGLATGFVIFYGTASRSYSQQVDVGYTTSYTVSGLTDSTTYYFAVRSYTATGVQSDFSAEVSSTTPSPVVTALSLTSSVPSPVAVGTPVTWSATATGGVAPYEFQWAVFHADQWTVGSWTPASTWTWTPSAPGSDYNVRVAVRSSGSTSTSGELTRTAPFTVTAPVSVFLSTPATSPQPAGTTINWSAIASGGAAPYQYKWWVYNGTSWSAATGWMASSTWSWKPNAASTAYIVRVWVRSAGSSIDAPEGSASVPFTITKKCQGRSCR